MRAQSILDSPLDLQHRESEIVDAVFQPEKSIRGEPVESCKLRYFNSFEFFDHTGTEFDGGPQNSEGPTALITAHPLLLSLMKLQQEHFQLAELEEPLQTCWTDLQAIWAETAR
jgi:hypothetical protein